MQYQAVATVFLVIFMAEIGDKTQLATMLFASDAQVSKWAIFIGAALALVLTSALGVVAGGWLGAHVSEKIMNTVAGVGFIAIGVWTLLSSG